MGKLGKWRQQENFERLASDLDKDIDERYTLADATSTKKRYSYALVVLAIGLTVLGIFYFGLNQRQEVTQSEQVATLSQESLEDLELADDEQSQPWTYEQFMELSGDDDNLGMEIHDFVEKYGKADQVSQSLDSQGKSVSLNYGDLDFETDQMSIAMFIFRLIDGEYRLTFRSATDLFGQTLAESSATSQSWTQQGYEALEVKDDKNSRAGTLMADVVETYGQPYLDIIVADEIVRYSLSYPGYEEGTLVELYFVEDAKGDQRLNDKTTKRE